MRTMRAQTPARTFWWDRARPIEAEIQPLRAVIFDADTTLADIERSADGLAPKAGLTDLVMSLFVAGIWVAVVSTRDRECTQTLVRQVIGEGLVETIVSGDDLDQPGRAVELYRLALWELGITAESALAIDGTERGLRAASAVGLPTLFVTDGYAAGHDCTDAAAVRASYAGSEPLSAAGCREIHRRWWIQQRRSQAA